MAAERQIILFVAGADEWYGSDYVLYETVRALRGSEFDAIVLVPNDQSSELAADLRLSGRLRAMGTEVHELPLTVLRRRYMTPVGALSLYIRSRGALRAATGVVGDRRVALVHSHTAAVTTGGALARALGVPHLWHVSEMVETPSIARRLIARNVARGSDLVIAVSHAVRDHLLATQPAAAAKTRVIYNGIDVNRFSAARGGEARDATSPRFVVGMIGRVGTWKGQELFLDAARLVHREMPEVQFVMAGGVLDGNVRALDALRARAAAAGMESVVRIQEYCPDTAALLATMDLFVQPSLRPDPLPTTVLEAMASALPVVATAHGGAPEMVQDGITGLLTPPGDAAAMAQAIVGLLRDPDRRARMGRAARTRVEAEFSPALFSASYLNAYRELASAQRRRGS
ncbi:MAG: glycosyltransferase family 4 protein [Gemmatimonadota bacterium]|nr:glycosyltransferase family 4 protein [Gemmatimonadota bacterium]